MRSIDPPAQVAVWDLPVRLFHWTLVALTGFSWWSAEQKWLQWHMWSGSAILALLLFRLLWGLFGSSTARFATFVRGPLAVISYLRDMRGWSGIGHSPLAALSVLGLLAALFFQVVTGLFQLDSDDFVEGPLAHLVSIAAADRAHDLHRLGFDLLLVLVGLHVAAILVYRVALGKELVWPMVTGSAWAADGTEPMVPASTWRAGLLFALAVAIAAWVAAGAPPLG